MTEHTDKWARWLMSRRDGDSDALRDRNAADLARFRDGVLDRAALAPGDTLLDVGCGTGLIGLGALERLGPDGRVIFGDISDELLDACRRAAGADARSSFREVSLPDLTGVADESVDVVAMRSVLMYADRKRDAFASIFRVLRPGGRVSLFEPINRFLLDHGPHYLFGLTGTPVDDLLARVGDAYRTTGAESASRSMVDFDERDLLTWAAEAGFTAIELDLQAQVRVPGAPVTSWESVKNVAPNPLAPTYAEAIAAALTEAEQQRLDDFMTTAAPTFPTRKTMATAFLRAVRP